MVSTDIDLSACGAIEAAAHDVPHLRAAVEAALSFHGRTELCGKPVCAGELDAHDEPVEWPCAEHQAITRALAGVPS